MLGRKTTLSFTRAELACIHRELGDIPKHLVGPKLLKFYRHLDALIELHKADAAIAAATKTKKVMKIF